jgi:hypothetical protein
MFSKRSAKSPSTFDKMSAQILATGMAICGSPTFAFPSSTFETREWIDFKPVFKE